LPNERGALGAVIVEALVRPLPGDQDAAAGDAQVFGLVRLPLHSPGAIDGLAPLGWMP
jgi:hypothetical protein